LLENEKNKMMKVAIVTYESNGAYPDYNALNEDIVLGNILQELGIDFGLEIWSDTSVDWKQYSHLLIKSPWDYFDRYVEFLDWCQKIKELGLKVFNSIDTIIWNSDKRYLLEIYEKGFHIVPTQFINRGASPDLIDYFLKFGTDQLVIKPTVSGGSKNTLKLNERNWKEQQDQIDSLLQSEDYMVQPFINEISDPGEYSYLFFNGAFSHAVLKSPKKGEFRVQHFFGGNVTTVNPSQEELDYIQKIVDEFASQTLYARVDGIWIEGVFYLMELELIEPYLFLFTSDKAKLNYKAALRKKLGIG
jgi:glutathione synthase/RimK-type ligase-like ATP-grasp enzyme